jgi:signal transduction histidine kinase
LLDISRIEQGKISLRLDDLVLQDVIGFAIETVQPSIEAGGHSLHLDMPASPVQMKGDHARVTQIIGNLVSNAARYTPNGGTIRVTLRVEQGAALIEVIDNGHGIAPEQQGRIFDIFAQVAADGRMNRDGLGIGLALVKQLVELHRGRITLKRSAPGQGSTFEICLPLAHASR